MQRPQHGQGPRQKPLLALALLAYGVILAFIVFWPRPVDRNLSGELARLLDLLHSAGVPAWINYELVEFSANVVLFLPAGLLLAAWLSPRWAWLAAVAGVCCSAAIETGQALLIAGRYGTAQDVIANGLGAALGTVMVYLWRAGASRRAEPAPSP